MEHCDVAQNTAHETYKWFFLRFHLFFLLCHSHGMFTCSNVFILGNTVLDFVPISTLPYLILPHLSNLNHFEVESKPP